MLSRSGTIWIPTVVVLSWLIPLDASAQFCPDISSTMSAGPGRTRPTKTACGDLNQDGHIDIITVNDSTDDVSVLRSLGERVFDSPVRYNVGDEPMALVVVDVNNNGHLDILTANHKSHNVSLLRNNGSGGFLAATTLPAGQSPFALAVADLDGDGHLDVVVANAGSDTITVLIGTGNGQFAAPVTYPTLGDAPTGVVACDLNGNGHLDLAVGHLSGTIGQGVVSIFISQGDGAFVQPPAVYPLDSNAYDIACCDLDGQNGRDLVTVDATSDTHTILYNQGSGTFDPPVVRPGGRGGYAVSCCDVDADGRPDILTANLISDDVTLFRNLGGGAFKPAEAIPIGENPSGIACCDLEGDGDIDLAVPLRQGVKIVYNTCGPCPNTIPGSPVDEDGCPPLIPGDFDRDGDVDSDDFAHFQRCVTGPHVGPPAPGCESADLDGDGDVDHDDFGLFQRCYSGSDSPADPACLE